MNGARAEPYRNVRLDQPVPGQRDQLRRAIRSVLDTSCPEGRATWTSCQNRLRFGCYSPGGLFPSSRCELSGKLRMKIILLRHLRDAC